MFSEVEIQHKMSPSHRVYLKFHLFGAQQTTGFSFLPSIPEFRVVNAETLLWSDACSTNPRLCLVLSLQALCAEHSQLSDRKQTLCYGCTCI